MNIVRSFGVKEVRYRSKYPTFF